MGSPVAPVVAILFLDRFERLALEGADLKPDFFGQVQSPAVATQHLRPAGLGHVIPTTASARPALPCCEQSKHHVTRTNEAKPRD